MSMVLHTLLGGLILSILWNTWIWRYFYSQKNLKDIKHEVHKWLD